MSEQLANLPSTTLNGAYTAGDGHITVSSASGFPTQGTFTCLILTSGGSFVLLFRVASVSGTTFTGAAEGTDANASNGDTVLGVLSALSVGQIKKDVMQDVSPFIGDGTNYFLPGGKVTPLTFGAFSWQNQGGASVTNNGNGTASLVGTTQNSEAGHMWGQAVPGTGTWTIEIGVIPRTSADNFNIVAGLGLYNSGTSKLEVVTVFYNSGVGCNVKQYNSFTSFASDKTAITLGVQAFTMVYFKIHWDGTDFTFYISLDLKASWILLYTDSAGTWIGTPTFMGVFLDGNSSNGSAYNGCTLFDWTVGA